MEGLEYISFQMIAYSGNARSLYIEAIQCAKNRNYFEANKCIEKADNEFLNAHRIHAKLIQEEAQNYKSDLNILLIHALDLMMSAESFGILSKEFINLYQKVID